MWTEKRRSVASDGMPKEGRLFCRLWSGEAWEFSGEVERGGDPLPCWKKRTASMRLTVLRVRKVASCAFGGVREVSATRFAARILHHAKSCGET